MYPIEYAADNKSFKCLLCSSVTKTAQGRTVRLQKRHMLTQRDGHRAWVEKNHWIFNVLGPQSTSSAHSAKGQQQTNSTEAADGDDNEVHVRDDEDDDHGNQEELLDNHSPTQTPDEA